MKREIESERNRELGEKNEPPLEILLKRVTKSSTPELADNTWGTRGAKMPEAETQN